MDQVRVFETEAELVYRRQEASAGRPAHWLNDNANHFHNPWPSWHYVDMGDNYAVSILSSSPLFTIS
jgi:hypothetical protein